MSHCNIQPKLRYQEARENGQMVCLYCGDFSSSDICWSCANLKQQINEAFDEKDKENEKLKKLADELTEQLIDEKLKHLPWP